MQRHRAPSGHMHCVPCLVLVAGAVEYLLAVVSLLSPRLSFSQLHIPGRIQMHMQSLVQICCHLDAAPSLQLSRSWHLQMQVHNSSLHMQIWDVCVSYQPSIDIQISDVTPRPQSPRPPPPPHPPPPPPPPPPSSSLKSLLCMLGLDPNMHVLSPGLIVSYAFRFPCLCSLQQTNSCIPL